MAASYGQQTITPVDSSVAPAPTPSPQTITAPVTTPAPAATPSAFYPPSTQVTASPSSGAVPASAPVMSSVPLQNLPPPSSTARLTVPVSGPPPFEVFSDYNWGNAMADKLRNAPAKLYNFDRASLRDVLRFLADDAGIPFVALQESSAAESTLVTFTLKASPFLALETIARANGVTLYYENGVWFMRPINERELIARIYKLKYNPQENIKYNAGNSSSGAATSVGSSQGGSGFGIPDMNINIQGATNVFEVKTPETVDQIKKLLGIPTSGVAAQLAGEVSVENFGSMQMPSPLSPSGSNLIDAAEGIAKGDSGAQVIYNSDANTIYIVATRQQHQWVEGFLSAVDRPQALIGIEVKFFETTKDPTKELGINWAGTMEGGFDVSLRDIQFSPTGAINVNNTAQALGGTYPFGQYQDPTRTGDQNYQITASAPYSAILSTHDVSVSLNAFLRDRDTTLVQYPRVLTVNNREVVIRSVINQPVLASTSSVTPGVGGTTAASVSYLPIGTIINILPKTMPDGSVVLNVAIMISSIVNYVPIQIQPGQTQDYPVAASRVYNAALQVDSGYTLAVSGLDEATDSKDDTGIPLLKDIPGVGELFKSKSRTQRKRNLIIFITPTVITNRSKSRGIAEVPESVIPIRPDDPIPPSFSPTGELVGGFGSLEMSLAWLDRQVMYFKQIIQDSRTDKRTIDQLKSVINTARMLLKEVQRMEESMPAKLDQLIAYEERLLAVSGELSKVLGDSYRNKNEF